MQVQPYNAIVLSIEIEGSVPTIAGDEGAEDSTIAIASLRAAEGSIITLREAEGAVLLRPSSGEPSIVHHFAHAAENTTCVSVARGAK